MQHEKDQLEKYYQAHHHKGDRYGYLVCHGHRKPLLQKWIGTQKKILDLGCRDGSLTEAFVEDNEVIGVDIDRTALATVEKNLKIKTCWIDLNKEWPFSHKSFDVIVACEILEHLFFIEKILKQITSSLKPGGLFIGSVPNSFRIRNRWKFLCGQEFDCDPTHVRRFSYQKIHSLLSPYYNNANILPLEGKFLPFCKISQSTPLYLGKHFAKILLWKAQKNEL